MTADVTAPCLPVCLEMRIWPGHTAPYRASPACTCRRDAGGRPVQPVHPQRGHLCLRPAHAGAGHGAQGAGGGVECGVGWGRRGLAAGRHCLPGWLDTCEHSACAAAWGQRCPACRQARCFRGSCPAALQPRSLLPQRLLRCQPPFALHLACLLTHPARPPSPTTSRWTAPAKRTGRSG